ncbi:hypothetical protein C8R45DRAFT_848226, partial [Mycena sanguinolenta]
LLVQHGVFPASPSRPRTGVSIDLLEVYRALFERSCDAITALAAALHTVYGRRGFQLISERNPGLRATDPFRSALSNAVLWLSHLRDRLQTRLAAALLASEAALSTPVPPTPPTHGGAPAPPTPPTRGGAPRTLTRGRAHRLLREHCPACFNLKTWGRPLAHGGDVMVGCDGNFNLRHLESAGTGPISYDPSYFVSKEKLRTIAERIAVARKKPPAKYNPLIPQDAFDACQELWDAANEKKQKTDVRHYDSSGVFVMTCRHSQVLFLCEMDTPGEQQKYIVALLEELNGYLPPQATIVEGYDVGCVTDHSFNLYPILREGFRARVSFIINAMHSFGHQWVCQMVYSPRLRRGIGLTDLEGVERFWSRIRNLIPITRNQWNSRCIWMIDKYVSFVNEEGLDGLGNWIHQQETKNLAAKQAVAEKVLRECRVSEGELRRQWEAQKAAQSSLRAHAPVRLKRELDKVLGLQVQIDAVEKSITEAKQSITGGDALQETLTLLRRLEATHAVAELGSAEALYASLNIQGNFPELHGLPLEFVQTLLLMRDLKINIRKRAVGSFYEWETLDRAVSGRRELLGTKLHQATRKAISRRQPALMRSIRKFNDFCEVLVTLRPENCTIPIPSALSTQLNGLRNDPTLHEDVWISPSEGPIPRWLSDDDVRDGIRSLHSADRCGEESIRLELEQENMEAWLAEEIEIVAHALDTRTDPCLDLALRERQDHLRSLKMSWQRGLSRLWRTATTHAPYAARPDETYEDGAAIFEVRDDLRTDMIVASEELDPNSISDAEEPLTVQDMLDHADDEEETSESANVDATLLRDLQARNDSFGVEDDRLQRVIGIHTIKAKDLDTLRTRHGRLNNYCLNGAAAALHRVFSNPSAPTATHANRCAVLSTLDLVRVRYKASDDAVWRFLNPTRYWDKPIWLTPIHQPTEEDWVLVVALIPEQKLFLFDSLGNRNQWRGDLKASISWFTLYSSAHQEEPWTALPLYNKALQSNGHDCGVWVLCTMAAVMRGYTTTSLSEADMGRARQVLTGHILTLPLT